MTDIINSLYRAYDATATTTEQLWRYLLPLRTLSACAYADALALVITWLSYGVEADSALKQYTGYMTPTELIRREWQDQPIYLAATVTAPHTIGYTTPIVADAEFIYWYASQWCQFTLNDLTNLVVTSYFRTKAFLLSLLEIMK
jgi:hypothetical protein